MSERAEDNMCGEKSLSFLALLILILTYVVGAQTENEYEDCGNTKGCLGLPENCVTSEDCKLFVSYIVNEDSKIEFTLSADLSNGQYASVALSDVQKMVNNPVMACWIDTSENPQDVFGSWNNFHSNVKLDNPTAGLTMLSKENSNGILKCTFTRETETVVTPPESDSDFTFNLMNDSFYILLAYGPMSGDALSYHTSRSITPEKINLFDPINSEENEYENCGTTKGCFGLPENCVASENCKFLASYMVNKDSKIEFTMSANLTNGQYASVALSDVQKMENNSVMACWVDTSGNPQDVFGSWNYLHSNVNLDNPTAGLVTLSKENSNGILKCTFTRETETVVTPPGLNDDFTFNLKNDSLYILLAYGPMSGDALSYHTERSISSERVNLFDPIVNNSTTTTTTTTTTTPSGGGEDENYNGCDETKGCFGYPENCINSKSCNVLVSFVMNTDGGKDGDGSVIFTLSGPLTMQRYLAVALSQDTQMTDSIVMACYYDENNIVSPAFERWNQGYTNVLLGPQDPSLDPGLTTIETNHENGIMSCKFQRERLTTILTPSGVNVTYDLKEKAYHLLLAYGAASKPGNDVMLAQHDDKTASPTAIKLDSYSKIGGNNDKKFIKAHGALMVFSWLFLAVIGMTTARYCKGNFAGKKLFGKDLWFPIHQLCMLLVWIIVMAALVIMLVKFKVNPLKLEAVKVNAHAAVGMASCCLAFVQPFMAFLRPGPDSGKRWLFNWTHRLVGESAFVLAVAAIYLTTLDSFGKLTVHQDMWIVVIMGSVHQSRLPSQFAFQCFNFPQLLNTQKNVLFHLNLHFNLQF